MYCSKAWHSGVARRFVQQGLIPTWGTATFQSCFGQLNCACFWIFPAAAYELLRGKSRSKESTEKDWNEQKIEKKSYKELTLEFTPEALAIPSGVLPPIDSGILLASLGMQRSRAVVLFSTLCHLREGFFSFQEGFPLSSQSFVQSQL
jgi:hypothetical protein